MSLSSEDDLISVSRTPSPVTVRLPNLKGLNDMFQRQKAYPKWRTGITKVNRQVLAPKVNRYYLNQWKTHLKPVLSELVTLHPPKPDSSDGYFGWLLGY